MDQMHGKTLGQAKPPRLVDCESWLRQTPCIDSSDDVFASVRLPGHVDLVGEPPNRWLTRLGDMSVESETASHLIGGAVDP
jgi:hypothetical protein